MNLAVGQVWISYHDDHAVVLEVRDEHHPRGLGAGYGDSAIAAAINGREPSIDPMRIHPFDAVILCAALPSHGPNRWRFVDTTHYLPSADGIFYAYPGGHPVRGDE